MNINKKKSEIENIKNAILPILKRFNVKKAGIFGSYARGEQNKESDIDILVEIDGSLLKVVNLELELRKTLRKNVDVLTYGGIHPKLKNKILKEEVEII